MNRILVVEDDAELPQETAPFLLSCGYPVAQGRGPDQAMALIAQQGLVPSLVILELDRPRIGRLDLLRWLRARPELVEVPVLIVTSLRSVELPPQVTAVLRKPCRPEHLLAIVDALCGKSPVGRAEAQSRARRLRMGGAGAKNV